MKKLALLVLLLASVNSLFALIYIDGDDVSGEIVYWCDPENGITLTASSRDGDFIYKNPKWEWRYDYVTSKDWNDFGEYSFLWFLQSR